MKLGDLCFSIRFWFLNLYCIYGAQVIRKLVRWGVRSALLFEPWGLHFAVNQVTLRLGLRVVQWCYCYYGDSARNCCPRVMADTIDRDSCANPKPLNPPRDRLRSSHPNPQPSVLTITIPLKLHTRPEKPRILFAHRHHYAKRMHMKKSISYNNENTIVECHVHILDMVPQYWMSAGWL